MQQHRARPDGAQEQLIFGAEQRPTLAAGLTFQPLACKSRFQVIICLHNALQGRHLACHGARMLQSSQRSQMAHTRVPSLTTGAAPAPEPNIAATRMLAWRCARPTGRSRLHYFARSHAAWAQEEIEGPVQAEPGALLLPALHGLHCSVINHVQLSAGRLLQRYKQMLDSGVLQPDVRQQETVSQLSVLADQLLKYKQEVDHFADKLEAYQVCCVLKRAAGERGIPGWLPTCSPGTGLLLAAAALRNVSSQDSASCR